MKIVFRNDMALGETEVYTSHFEKAEIGDAVALIIDTKMGDAVSFTREEALELRDYIDKHFGRSDK